MATTTRHVRYVQGDSKVLRVTVTVDGEVLDAAALPAARYRVAKRLRATATPVITKALGEGIAAVDGKLEITLLPADSLTLKGEYFHELEVIDSAGRVMTAFQGKFTLDPALIP